jgi:RNA polymerase sigma factor (sigma-70 family)
VEGGQSLERAYREEATRVRAALAAWSGDVGLAEDALQDAFVEAAEHWPSAGTPANPGGWLTTTARRKALDRIRRDKNGAAKLTLLASGGGDGIRSGQPDGAGHQDGIGGPAGDADRQADDELLSLAFACCHPALPREAQTALTLRAVCGLTTGEIAAAFLVSEPTMSQRLLRARKTLRSAAAKIQIPDPDELNARLTQVLEVAYLVFNEGYLASSGRQPARRDLAAQAIALTRTLHRLMPCEPEVLGLLALLLLHESRAAARFDGWGRLIRLEEQDRGKWDERLAGEATGLLDRAIAMRRPGPYQVQAAIAALHAQAPEYGQTDWRQIRLLYDTLQVMTPSPVVLLNRAVATRYAIGPEAALRETGPLRAELDGYHLFHALRAALLTALGRDDEARAASERALALTANPAERMLLARELPHLHQGAELDRDPAAVDARPGLRDLDRLVHGLDIEHREAPDDLLGLDVRTVGDPRPADGLGRARRLKLRAAVGELAGRAHLLVPGPDLGVPLLVAVVLLEALGRVHDQHHVLHVLLLLIGAPL